MLNSNTGFGTILNASMCDQVILQLHEKAGTFFSKQKAFFVRHSSKYETSDSDRKVNRNIWMRTDSCYKVNNE